MRTKSYLIFRVLGFALVLTTLPQSALAHATPVQYVPAASSVLSRAPAEVQIHFSERIEPRVSSIVVIAPDGSRADRSNSAADPADPRVFRVGLNDSGAGTYTVSWEVISTDDGHFAKGAYVFSVGNAKPGASADRGGFQTVHSSGVPEALEKLAALPMAVLTNKPARISVRILDALGLSKYFRVIYGGNSFETKKPDPLGANTILGELGAAPGEAILIGDSEVDVQTARNAGMLAAAVNYGFGVHDRVAHPADIYLDRLSELIPLLGTPCS